VVKTTITVVHWTLTPTTCETKNTKYNVYSVNLSGSLTGTAHSMNSAESVCQIWFGEIISIGIMRLY